MTSLRNFSFVGTVNGVTAPPGLDAGRNVRLDATIGSSEGEPLKRCTFGGSRLSALRARCLVEGGAQALGELQASSLAQK